MRVGSRRELWLETPQFRFEFNREFIKQAGQVRLTSRMSLAIPPQSDQLNIGSTSRMSLPGLHLTPRVIRDTLSRRRREKFVKKNSLPPKVLSGSEKGESSLTTRQFHGSTDSQSVVSKRSRSTTKSIISDTRDFQSPVADLVNWTWE